MNRLLIIEDDKDLRETLAAYLGLKGYSVVEAATLTEAGRVLASGRIDLVLLDLNLPDGDGLTLLRQLREHSRIPLFVVSGRSDERSRLATLELSADDYIVKPVNLRELTLKIGNFQTRFQLHSPRMYPMGAWIFDPADQSLSRLASDATGERQVIRLKSSESRCLESLLEAEGRLVPFDTLLTDLHLSSISMSRESLPVMVSNLRKKLKEIDGSCCRIEGVPRRGYRLNLDPSAQVADDSL